MKKLNQQEVDSAIYSDADPVELPENAFRELGADEHYRPIMHPARDYAEVTPYSVAMGLILAVVFSAAAAYLGLRVGQVFEAAIPIAIIAVGLSGALGKKNPLGQNVIIQSIGACSGVIVAKIMNKFSKDPINPLIGSAGVSAVPMAARVSQIVGQKEKPGNFLLMHAMGPNVAGVIGSAIAAGVFLALFM